jgi:hypothetical protein
LAFAVLNEVIVKVEPDVNVPVALPSSAGAGASAKSWKDSAPAGIEVAEGNCGDQRYMLDPAESAKEPAPWTTASQNPEMLLPEVAVQVADTLDCIVETTLYASQCSAAGYVSRAVQPEGPVGEGDPPCSMYPNRMSFALLVETVQDAGELAFTTFGKFVLVSNGFAVLAP